MFVDIDLGKVGQADGVWEGAVVGALDFGGEVIGVGGDDDESGFEVFGEGVEDEMEGVFLVWSHEERADLAPAQPKSLKRFLSGEMVAWF